MIKLYSLEKGVRGPHCKDEDNHMVLKVYDCPTHQMRESNPKDENNSPQFCPSRLTLTRQASRPMPGDSAIRLVGWKAWQKLRDMRNTSRRCFSCPARAAVPDSIAQCTKWDEMDHRLTCLTLLRCDCSWPMAHATRRRGKQHAPSPPHALASHRLMKKMRSWYPCSF